jgi:hypothetical protein
MNPLKLMALYATTTTQVVLLEGVNIVNNFARGPLENFIDNLFYEVEKEYNDKRKNIQS